MNYMFFKKLYIIFLTMLFSAVCYASSAAEITIIIRQSHDLIEWSPITSNTFISGFSGNAYYNPDIKVLSFDPQEEAVAGVDAFIGDPQLQPTCISVWNSRGDPSMDADNPGKYRNVILIAPEMFVMTKHYRLGVGDFVLWQDGEDTFMRQVVETKFHSWMDIGIGWLDKPVPVPPSEVFDPALITPSVVGYVSGTYPVIGFDCDEEWCVHEIAYYKPTITLMYPNKVYAGDNHLSGESGRPVFAHIRGHQYLVGLFISINKTLVAVTDDIIEQIKNGE